MDSGLKQVTMTVSELEELCSLKGQCRQEILEYYKRNAGHKEFTNYETWHTHWCIAKDENLHRDFRRYATHLLEKYNRTHLKPYRKASISLTNQLKTYFIQQTEQYGDMDLNAKALLSSAYSAVNWEEIADVLLKNHA